MIDETITYLEMTSQDEVVPGRVASSRVELEEVLPGAVSMARSTYARIGAPLAWEGRTEWSDAGWEGELARPGIRAWLGLVNGAVAGLVELEAETNGDVGIVVFGLVPEFVGMGFGGAFLTVATQLAWTLTSPTGVPTTRVWVQTSSRDHPHALSNYERRGFRVFGTDHRQSPTHSAVDPP